MRARRLPWLLGSLLAAGPIGAADYQLGVREDGVYRLTWEQLADAGLEQSIPTAQLSLSHRGNSVGFQVDDGGDGVFGPGDHLDFIGEHLAGDNGHYSEHSPWNVYRLAATSVSKPGGASFPDPGVAIPTDPAEARVHWRGERDRLRVRFNAHFAPENPEIWYWQRLSVLDSAPFAIDLPAAWSSMELSDARLRIGLRGWSTPQDSGGLPQHRVEVLAGDRIIGAGEWDGQAAHVIEIDGLDWHPGQEPLALRVPRRALPGSGGDIVDVSLLNWIELDMPYVPDFGADQTQLLVQRAGVLPIQDEGARLFGQDQGVLPVMDGKDAAVSPGTWWLVRDGAFRQPAWVREDMPSGLRGDDRQADYLIIAHESLIEATAALAEFHQRQGLSVALVDVQDVYDEFNHGIVHPRAIRDFIAHADQHWRTPSPRFVLLVGDASWDNFNEKPDDRLYADWTFQPRQRHRFGKNRSTPYNETVNRALIPAFSVATYEGYAASDNGFVTIRGDDRKPDLAIGRLPVVNPTEVDAIVAKIETYVEHAVPGPWRRNTLWIASDQRIYQGVTEELIALPVLDEFKANRVFPDVSQNDNTVPQQAIIDAFDEGSALVHFVGHGGRYIWTTRQPDGRPGGDNDLFSLDHLDQLAPSRRLPVVLSMTCYSAPFDHPTADSIGEKFLRLPERGAIAVLAASWRNFPSPVYSHALLHAFMAEATIGEAVMKAKRRMDDPLLVETYNLLGDPALTLAIPRGRMELSRVTAGVTGRLPDAPGSGSVLVDFLDSDGRVVGQREASFAEQRFEVRIPVELAGSVHAVRAYAWSAPERYDAAGHLVFDG